MKWKGLFEMYIKIKLDVEENIWQYSLSKVKVFLILVQNSSKTEIKLI